MLLMIVPRKAVMLLSLAAWALSPAAVFGASAASAPAAEPAVAPAPPVAGPSPRARAPITDSMAQRVQACTACHGEQGVAAADGYYPRIAGKPAGYLYHQLLNFRDGRRHGRLMQQMVAPLNEPYLKEIAEHFAALDLPYPPAAVISQPPAAAARGQTLALYGDKARGIVACVQCHGQALTGQLPATPGLLGLPRDYLNGQLGAWRAGQRRAHAPDCMAEIAKRMSQDDVSAVSGWLAAQPTQGVMKPEPDPGPKAHRPMECGSVKAASRSDVTPQGGAR